MDMGAFLFKKYWDERCMGCLHKEECWPIAGTIPIVAIVGGTHTQSQLLSKGQEMGNMILCSINAYFEPVRP